jgi:hypothetical protein
MKVYEHPTYDGQFPENFPWTLIDSISLSHLAGDLARQIKIELGNRPEKRINVPGLRCALQRIASMAEITILP